MHYFLLIFIFFALIFDKLNIFFYLVLSSLFHEIGHITACYICGYKPQVEMSLFGIKLKGYPETNLKKMIVLMCGPLINLIIVIVSKIILYDGFNLDIYVFMVVNLIVFVFNCLPVHFLDGGQIIGTFCDNICVRNILDLISFIFVVMVIILFSSNKVLSALLFFIFIIYYIINKKTAF